MYILGHRSRLTIKHHYFLWATANRPDKVAYQAGVNEKLLGDFIKKHNIRDKVFGAVTFTPLPNIANNSYHNSRLQVRV